MAHICSCGLLLELQMFLWSLLPRGLTEVVVWLAGLTPTPPKGPSLAGYASPALYHARQPSQLILPDYQVDCSSKIQINLDVFHYPLMLQWSKSAESPQTSKLPPPLSHTLTSLLVLLGKLLPWEAFLEGVTSHRRH